MERFNTTYNLGLLLIFLLSGFSVYLLFTKININKDTNETNESFQINLPVDISNPTPVLEEVIGDIATQPSAKNPFMNVLIDEIKYNPTRAAALSVLDPSVSISLDQFFKTNFTNDPTDVFGRSQSQRQFYVTPSTTVPNNMDSYQNWLYKIPGKTCKEGGREACSMASGSAGGVIPWLTEN